MCRKTLLIVSLVIFAGAINVSAAEIQRAEELLEWTVDAHVASKSNFKLFGSTASDDPIGVLNITADFGAWDVTFIACQGIGRHEEGIGATENYYDLVISWSHNFGKDDRWSLGAGSEFFYAPPQLGGEHLQFIAPFVTLSRDWNEIVSTTFGLQSPIPIDTEYGGDAVFGWAEVSLSHTWHRLTGTLTLGGVLGETIRHTEYLSPALEWEFENGMILYASYLGANNVTGDGVSSRIDPTPTIGVKWTG